MASARRDLCWICTSPDLVLERPSRIEGELRSDAFAITDSRYGVTGALSRCGACGFLQCSDLTEVVRYYETLEDVRYEETRGPRSRQMRRLLELVRGSHPIAEGTRLLDIGAGSGLLVAQAAEMGLDAVGVEPSRWLRKRALERGIPVEEGTFPHPALPGRFGVVTMVDVIEHVTNPVELLRAVAAALEPDGLAVVVTPDVGALVPRVLGRRWWHFRVAHVGYFRRATLDLALRNAGLEPIHHSRPTWVLDVGYLIERVSAYLPRALRPPVPGWLRRIWLPVSLGDVMMTVARPARPGA